MHGSLMMSLNSFRASLVAGLVLLVPIFAEAKSYTIPDGKPAAVVTVPDDWSVEETKIGIEAESDDEEVYLAIEVTDWEDAAKSIAKAIIWLEGRGVQIDKASEERKEFTINGMEGVEVKWVGKDEDGPAKVSVSLLRVNDSRGLILTYWASPEGEKTNLKDLISIAETLKPVR